MRGLEEYQLMGRILAVLIVFSASLHAQSSGPVQTANDLFDKAQYADVVAAIQNVAPAERSASLLNRLAVSYHLLNKVREAETAYRDAIRKDEKLSDAYNNLGALYYSRKNFGEAERQFRKALEADSESAAAKKNLRSARYARENGRKARDMAVDMEKLRPLLIEERTHDSLTVQFLMPKKDLDEAQLYKSRGDSFMARKMYEDAIIEYRKSFQIDRYNALTANLLGLAYHQSMKTKEAESNYREALKINPYYVEALNNLGTIEFAKKQYSRAMDQYNKALKIRPNSATILHNVGACLFAMERFEEGLMVYQSALKIDPQLFQHMSGFGTIIQTAGRNDSMQNFYLAKVFAGIGDKDRAISLLYRAVENGFKDAKKIKGEPAFSELQTDERFLKLMETMAQPGSGMN
jgi:tetratricopeptide (TPR) repeat protein